MTASGVVIVGGSVGGVKAAKALRAEGFDGKITILEKETHPPYDKPPLSKGVLGGSQDVEDIALLGAIEARDLDLEVRLDITAAELHVETCTVLTACGKSFGYTDLIIATGSTPWIPPSLAMPGVHVVRTLDDCLRLRSDLVAATSMLIVGAGFLGAEVASVMAGSKTVHLVDVATVPMARLGNDEVGSWFTMMQEERGINTHFGVGVRELSPSRSGAFEVGLTNGTTLVVDVILVATGARPNAGWAERSGLPVEDGVLCDPFLGVVGLPRHHALGDVARWRDSSGTTVRSEHWTSAVEQASYVARKIARGVDEPFDTDDYVWSDQHGWKVQMVGRPSPAYPINRTVGLRGDRLAALFGDDESLRAALVVNWPRALIELRRYLRAKRPVPVAEAARRIA